MKNNDIEFYRDIINIKNFEPKHPRMERYKRAAQFAPFSALTGYEESIYEAGRLVDKRPIISEDAKDMIDTKLSQIIGSSNRDFEIKVTFFKEDPFKQGGEIVSKKGKIRKIRMYEKEILFEDGTVVEIKDLLDIEFER